MFVCTGNTCRSPMAEIVTREIARHAKLASRILVSSAGTGDWHVGEAADERTVAALARRGYDGSKHRARQFDAADFASQDLIVYFDHTHERALRALARSDADLVKLSNITSFETSLGDSAEVPDPYYASDETFDQALELIEQCARGLVRQLAPALRASR